MSVDIKVPSLGESVVEATVAKWYKNEGDSVTLDEPLLELETDKVTLEVPSPTSGLIEKISSPEGSTVEVGALLGVINDTAEVKKAPENSQISLSEKISKNSFLVEEIDISLIEVKKELEKFVKITSKMNYFTKQLILETDRKKISKLLHKLEQYEEITDRIENEVSEFLTKVNENDITSKSSEDIRSILSIISELESIGDVYYSISKNLQRKTEKKLQEQN